MTIKIGICGASGKMGKTIIELIRLGNYLVSGKFNSANQIEDLATFCQNSEVIIDFSSSEILEKLLYYATIHKNKLVIGTTGLTEKQLSCIREASKEIAILYSANMSLGANLIASLVATAAHSLGNDFDVEILEAHHRMKKDSPSGTAIMLGQTIAAAKNQQFDKCVVYNRYPNSLRQTNEIGITSIRGGQVYGEHEIFFLGDNEVITIKHQALNREIFAEGAIKAAQWLFDKNNGLYSMKDILK